MATSLHTYKVVEMSSSKERKVSALIPHAHSRYIALNYQVISELQIRSLQWANCPTTSLICILAYWVGCDLEGYNFAWHVEQIAKTPSPQNNHQSKLMNLGNTPQGDRCPLTVVCWRVSEHPARQPLSVDRCLLTALANTPQGDRCLLTVVRWLSKNNLLNFIF